VKATAFGVRFVDPTLESVSASFRIKSIVPVMQDSKGLSKSAGSPSGWTIITFEDSSVVHDALAALQNNAAVEYAEPDYLMHIDFVPNDSAWSSQWGTRRIGAEKAWDKTRGSSTVRIGIIDTGIDYLHDDLKGQLWINSAEDINHNGTFEPWPAAETRNGVTGDLDDVDNDGNGVVDDVIGYDFVDEQGMENAPGGDYRDPDADPLDDMGHGTSVSGIIGAAINNNVGIAGIAPDCRLMTLRAFDARGIGAESDVARALAYAVNNGASIINMSFGDVVYSRLLRDMVRWAWTQGVTMLASAGNSGTTELHYPSAYDEVISVAATNESDGLAGFSNYGQTITIAAPGQSIVTTDRNNGYTSFNGTSASAPFVSAVAALVKSLHKDFTPEEIRGLLISTADDIGSMGWDSRFGAGLVNASRAVELEHPTEVRIMEPSTGTATSAREIVVRGTAASPLMTGFTLSYGIGLEPVKWTTLVELTHRQAVAETLAVWDVSALRDTTYILRLSATSETGTSLEHRVVLHIDHTAPVFNGIGFIPSVDGSNFGVAAGFITNEPTLGKLWYRIKGSSDEWKWISVESGTINNLFVATAHSVFLGEPELTPGATYELYFTAENEAGLISTARDKTGNFELTLPQPVPVTGFDLMPYSLPVGRLYGTASDFNGNGYPELLFNDQSAGNRLRADERPLNAFVDIAGGAAGDRIVRGIGDIDKDGLQEMLCSMVRKGFIYKQSAAGVVPDHLIWADTTSKMFWPVCIADVNNDGVQEVLAVTDDSTVSVYVWAGSTLSRIGSIVNPTAPPSGGHNEFSSPRAAIGDFNGNGSTDLLFGDKDGDFFIVESRGGGNFRPIWKSENDFEDASEYVAAGDFDGDGHDEFAVGFHTASDDVIPFWYFGIGRLNSSNQSTMLWTQEFHGVEEAGKIGYFADVENSLSVAQLGNGSAKDLVISTFPELYVVKWSQAKQAFELSWYTPMANTNAAVCADFNRDGINELAFAKGDSIVFYQPHIPYTGPAPARSISAEYVDPTQIRVMWTAESSTSLWRVYKGADASSMQLFGEFQGMSFTDNLGSIGGQFMYAVRACDSTAVPKESEALVTRVFKPHERPAVDTVMAVGLNQVRARVSQSMGVLVPKTSCFRLDAMTEPVSVVLLDEYNLLLTFSSVADGLHSLSVVGLRDKEGIPFDESILSSFEKRTVVQDLFFIEQGTLLAGKKISVKFNRPVNASLAVETSLYSFEPEGIVASAEVDNADPSIVYLTIVSNSPIGALGHEYIIKVHGLSSADGVPIVTGAGSTVGIIINMADLSQVYTYPNPLRVSDGQDFITFANLTQRAVIRIYTPSGAFVREIVAKDGTGGAQWDLRDDGGTRVADGIYIYYVTGHNTAGAEVTPVKGKCAIVR
jgi:subtilisin family serine protease